MQVWRGLRACALGLGLTLLGAMALALPPRPALADDLAAFNAAVERAAAHNRVALGYLRTDSIDLAVIELERMQAAWGELVTRFGKTPPDALRDNPLFVETMVDVPTKIVGTMLVMEMGRTDLARAALQEIRETLSRMRRASGIVVLADCVLDANAAMAAFFKFDEAPPDWDKPQAVAGFEATATTLAEVMRRCDSLADAQVRQQPEFRRLIDGTLASLAFVPQAVARRDADLIHRLVGELRAFDNLLVFRYG
ncbi:MAG TPA: hypothetical protein VNR11_18480 [Xanthobacteraceae bacterium]|nr:hypothetical protein [Xanthobacteraceae bacterium]